jgi:uncharacterized membrane protein
VSQQAGNQVLAPLAKKELLLVLPASHLSEDPRHVSLEGVLLVTFVLIKQNRMTHLSDRRAHLDLQINLLAEREVTHVLRLLQRVAHRLQVLEDLPDEKLIEDTQVEGLIETLDQKLKQEGSSDGSAAGSP